LNGSKENLGINGFIGTDILGQFILTIDFKQQVIHFNII